MANYYEKEKEGGLPQQREEGGEGLVRRMHYPYQTLISRLQLQYAGIRALYSVVLKKVTVLLTTTLNLAPGINFFAQPCTLLQFIRFISGRSTFLEVGTI